MKYPLLTDGGSEDAQSSAVSGAQNRYDDCSGVQCPELDCPTRPYIPQGECCPICPGLYNISNISVIKGQVYITLFWIKLF